MNRFLMHGRWMLAWVLVVSLAGLARADDERETIDPEAEKVVKSAADYLSGMKSYRVDLAVTQKIAVLGQKMEMNSDYDLAFRRPDHVAFVLKEGINGMTMISNGEKFWQYMPMLRRYTEADAPKDLNEALATAGGAGGAQGPDAILGGVTSANPYEAIMAGVTGLKLLESEEIDGAKCHHLQGYQDEMDWQMWIEEGETPLVRRFQPDISGMLEQLTGAAGGAGADGLNFKMEMEVAMGFDNWSVDPELSDDLFVFDPPKGVEKVDQLFDLASLMKGLGGAAGGDEPAVKEEPEEVSLLGQDAPNFELATLDEGTLDLETLKKEEDIIVLDFWATWCPPCVKGLPVVSEVAGKLAKKGVRFYAVNVREDAETIQEFLDKKELDINVALDAEGEVTQLYGVRGIPQTVIIGRNGTVQAIHIGFSDEVAETLEEELTALLAGEDLAAKALLAAEEAEASQSDDAAVDEETVEEESVTKEPAPKKPANDKQKQKKQNKKEKTGSADREQ